MESLPGFHAMGSDSIDEQTNADAVLELDSIYRKFGSLEVLKGLSLAVNRGEVYGFLGRNGAGKSTAIRIMMGITKADRGVLRLFGQSIKQGEIKQRQRIGYVAQEQNFYRWMTPTVLGEFVSGFYPRWGEQRYRQLVDTFDLPVKRKIGTFSGGMKARLALSVALATNPELLILDEPTAGMDPVARREFVDLVRAEALHSGATVFFSTHLIDDIEAVADRIGIIESGKSLYQGALQPLTDSIRSFSVALADAESLHPLPGEFVTDSVRRLQQRDRRDRREIILQFPASVTGSLPLHAGWREDTMTLEDVFVAVVSAKHQA